MFKKAAEAYEVLSNPDKRARYDQYGHQAFEGGGFGGMNMDDIFSQFGDIGAFGAVLAADSVLRRSEPSGSNLRFMQPTLEEIAGRGKENQSQA